MRSSKQRKSVIKRQSDMHLKTQKPTQFHDTATDREFNAATNVPYALVNLALDRHHLRSLPNTMEVLFNRGSVDMFRSTQDYTTGSVRRPNGPMGLTDRMDGLTLHSIDIRKGDTVKGGEGAADDGVDEANELGRAYKNWMENHFSMHPECVIPVPSPRNPKVCVCGREIGLVSHCLPPGGAAAAEHDVRLREWKLDTNVALSPTHSYGLIVFKDPPPGNDDDPAFLARLRSHIQLGRPYIRLSSNDCLHAPQMVKDLLVSKWDLEPPRILLGVTGGAGTFDIPPKLDDMIKLGLEKAAQSESMWITTGGTNTGVMKYVGAAIAASKSFVPVIGILPYAVVNNKEALDVYPKDGKAVAGGLVYYGDPDAKTDSGLGPGTSLDRNHTHYLLVDSGKVGAVGFGSEIESRSKIEQQVALLYSSGKFGSESPISSVLLAIQGGPGTVQTIYEALCVGTPVVVVDGSGKACNAIAFAYKLPLPGERQDGTEYTESKLAALIMEEFGVDEESKVFQKVFDTALRCVREYRELIRVYEASFSGSSSEESLDVAILNTVLDDRQDAKKWERWRRHKIETYGMPEVSARLRERDLSRALKLEMALMWNRINVVEAEMAKYCVLPSLATLSPTLQYKVLPVGARTYRTVANREVTLRHNETVTLRQMREEQWLVEVTRRDVTEQCWVAGSHLARANQRSFADAVTLAQMAMLEYLLIHEKLDFVELFLQGMRTDDIHAFLAVRRQELWAQAANYSAADTDGGGVDVMGADTEDTMRYLKEIKRERRMRSVDRMRSAMSAAAAAVSQTVARSETHGSGRSGGASSEGGHHNDGHHRPHHNHHHEGGDVGASKKKKTTGVSSHGAHGVVVNGAHSAHSSSDPAADERGKQAPVVLAVVDVPPPLPPPPKEDSHAESDHSAPLDEEAQRLLQQAKAFDDSDTHLPPYVDGYFYTGVVEAQLKCWVNKKKKQLAAGFDIQPSHRDMVKRLGGERNPSLRQLSDTEKQVRYEDAIWLLKFLFHRGYIVSMYSESQIAPGPDKLANVDNHHLLVEGLAETLHHRWLQRKVEDHWKYGPKYVNNPQQGRKESPYILLFNDLPPNDKTHNISYSRQLLTGVLEKGMWIWRPDNLERLYFLSMDHQTIQAGPLHHLERRLPAGVIWRAEVHSALRSIIGGGYVSDFSTFNALDPRFHLMVWCICTFRFELAKFFWQEQKKDSLINAIVCALICRQLVKKRVKNELTPEQISKFKETEEEYKANALAILQECVDRDSLQTKQLLKAQYPQTGWMTMWASAYLLHDKTFTSQEVFIDTVWTEWLGKLRETNFLKVCLGILMPIPYLMLFTSGEPSSYGGFRSLVRAAVDTVALGVDDSALHRVHPPSIVFRGAGRPIELHTATVGAVIYFTVTPGREGLDPHSGDASVYHDGSGSKAERTRIVLDEPKIYTIKACAKVPGDPLLPSAVTTKVVDMGQIDKVDGDVPRFVFGPRAHSARQHGHTGFLATTVYRVKCFYDAPYVTFYTFTLTSLVYTFLYSYVAIVTTVDWGTLVTLNSSEYIATLILYGWTLTLVVDEIRQALLSGLHEWWSGQGGSWNRVDALVYMIVFVSALLRIKNEPNDEVVGGQPADLLRVSRFMFALGALVVWLRLSRMYALSPTLGPKLVMIFTMMGDVFVFLALLVIVMMGYGVAMHAILEPWRTFDVNSPMTVMFKPMFNAIGETFVEEIQAHTQCLGPDFTQCDDYSPYLVLVMLVVYLIISNILLVNLLIAMMAQTYQTLSENSTAIWSIQNIDLLEEFREMLPLPPPLNLLYNVVDGLRLLLRRVLPARSSNKVGPSRSAKVEVCAVDSSTQLTHENHQFLEDSTRLFEESLARRDKNKQMKEALEGLINVRMKRVDHKLSEMSFQLTNLSKDLKDANFRRR